MRRSFLVILSIVFVAITASAQILDPIKWSSKLEMTSDKEGVVKFSAEIEDGWHLYGFNLPKGGPISTSINFTTLNGVELVGDIVPSVAPIEKLDMIFHLNLSYWENNVSFTQKIKVTGDDGFKIAGQINFMSCNDTEKRCLPLKKESFDLSQGTPTDNTQPVVDSTPKTLTALTPVAGNDLWAPVVIPSGDNDSQSTTNAPWWHIFILGFLGGFVALLTPCVWPMIPLTVSFFLKKNTSRSRSITDAIVYGLAIVVIYLILGLAITLIFGASKLNDLSTNAVFNLIFFALLIIFAISFFGAFDIRLPASWSSKMDNKAERTTGLLSIFFMAFTLALVSFSCTGPIIGTLLVEAASIGNISGPAIGMTGFALGLAIPFAIFATFPSMLKEMPRSGGWLNSVKVVLGFLELALSLKFLSVADLAYGWGILDREVFVSIWVIIFALLGFYLLGKIRFPHDDELESVSVPRFFMALVSLSFAIYLLPGLWGAPLKSVSAFVPPLKTQDFNLYQEGNFKEFDDYDAGMKYAADNNLPVLIDFSGHGCVNCRKMEGAVFDTDKISSIIENNFVLIKLMVDEKLPLANPYKVTENGKQVSIETIGEKWSYLQRHKFGANSQPYYIVLDNAGQPMTGAYFYDEDVDKFADWLNDGINNYSKAQ